MIMRGGSVRKSSGLYSLILCSLLALLLACVSSAPLESRSSQLEWKVEQWFAQLAALPPELGTEDRLLDGTSLAFDLAEGGDPAPGGLRAWLLALRSPHRHVEFQLHEMSLLEVDPQTRRLRFELERRAVGEDGLPHVARSLQTWLIHERTGSADVVFRVESVPLLAFPGTGPQIVCY